MSSMFCTLILTLGGGRGGVKKFAQAWQPNLLKFLFVCTLAKAGNMYFSFLSMKFTSLPGHLSGPDDP